MGTNKTTEESTIESLVKKRRESVSKLIDSMEANLTSGTQEKKASVTDYVRLIHLEQELVEEDLRGVRLNWVDPEEKKDSEQ
jgi:phenylalanyl-tRNA synthetase beta subunit